MSEKTQILIDLEYNGIFTTKVYDKRHHNALMVLEIDKEKHKWVTEIMQQFFEVQDFLSKSIPREYFWRVKLYKGDKDND